MKLKRNYTLHSRGAEFIIIMGIRAPWINSDLRTNYGRKKSALIGFVVTLKVENYLIYYEQRAVFMLNGRRQSPLNLAHGFYALTTKPS